jgi:CheY-like chemotaxis protein
MMLPGISGRQLAAELRRLRPEFAIVFMTGYAADGVASRTIDPAELVLSKPFKIADLQRCLRKAIEPS